MTHQEDCLGLCFRALGWVWDAQEMSWGDLLGQVHLSFFFCSHNRTRFWVCIPVQQDLLKKKRKRIKFFWNGFIKSRIICETCQWWEEKKLKPSSVSLCAPHIYSILSGLPRWCWRWLSSCVCIVWSIFCAPRPGADWRWRLLSSEPGCKK